MSKYLEQLNEEQKLAVTTLDGPMLILAGAGTGKTTTIVSRVAYMLEHGIPAQSILLLTFTNKAAKEMKGRVASMVGGSADGITASTFHSFCANFLRRYADMLDFTPRFTIMDASDAHDAIAVVRAEYLAHMKAEGIEYDLDEFPSSLFLENVYATVVNQCIPLSRVISESSKPEFRDDITDMIKRYRMYKKEHECLDYDDLLFFTLKILKENPDIRGELDEHYRMKMVDEYQDTNVIQEQIINLISKHNNNLAVVGDMHQSIYKFRGACVENIMSFADRHPGCKVITIQENYRSSQEILDLSNAFMQYINEGTPNTLNGQFHGEKPELIVVENNFEECEFIIDSLRAWHKKGIAYHDMAVIERSSRSSYQLESKLNEAGIPFNKYGGMKFTEKVFVKDILAFLRVLVNLKDEIAMYRILQLYPGIGKAMSKKITTEIKCSGLASLNTMFPKRKFAPYLKEVYDTLQRLRPMKLQSQLNYLVETYYETVCMRLIHDSKISEDKKHEKILTFKKEQTEARELYTLASEYVTATSFLNDFVLDNNVRDDKEDRLNITTIHSAKGLEYDIAFIMDVVEGITPKTDEGNIEADAEEQRCFYVAITRAKKHLYLMAPRYFMARNEIQASNKLSHFINKDDVINTMGCNVSYTKLQSMRTAPVCSWNSSEFA